MATKFFKKFEPGLGVNVGGTAVVKFKTLDDLIGYYATDNEGQQIVLRQHIEAGRYGLSEITWDEFDREYVKKKTTTPRLNKPWREEISNQTLRSNRRGQEPPAAVADVSDPRPVKPAPACARMTIADAEPSEQAVAAVAAVAEALNVPFQPTVGKREPRI